MSVNITHPKVSVGMPVYNGEKYLEKALDSVLSQTFSDFELIISDNASTDRTQEICQTYIAKDQRIRYYRNEENIGAAKNYNQVFEMCSGKYFKWAAYDDLCAPEYLEQCVDILDQNPDVVLCYPRSIFIDGEGEIVEDNLQEGFNLTSSKPYERFHNFFKAGAWCNPVFGLIRTSMLKQTSLIGNYAVSDRVLLGELSLIGKIYEIPDHLFYRRLHPQISTRAYVTDDERATWFDPMARNIAIPPRLKRFFKYVKAITNAPLGYYERMRCYIEVGRFYLSFDRVPGIGRDLVQFVGKVSRFFFRRNQKHAL